jgi:hypothetical protein
MALEARFALRTRRKEESFIQAGSNAFAELTCCREHLNLASRARALRRMTLMNDSFQEVLEGQTYIRSVRDARHEDICTRLHEWVASAVACFPGARLLPRRSAVQLSHFNSFCPDLALVTAATGKLWLAGEVVSPHDHRIDTVTKKTLYEDLNVPRLWMIDPRYDNIEVYHGHPHGLALQRILSGDEKLEEKLLPAFSYPAKSLFHAAQP